MTETQRWSKAFPRPSQAERRALSWFPSHLPSLTSCSLSAPPQSRKETEVGSTNPAVRMEHKEGTCPGSGHRDPGLPSLRPG